METLIVENYLELKGWNFAYSEKGKVLFEGYSEIGSSSSTADQNIYIYMLSV